jgi:hypothetical protein
MTAQDLFTEKSRVPPAALPILYCTSISRSKPKVHPLRLDKHKQGSAVLPVMVPDVAKPTWWGRFRDYHLYLSFVDAASENV